MAKFIPKKNLEKKVKAFMTNILMNHKLNFKCFWC